MGYASHMVLFQLLHWVRDRSGSKIANQDCYLSCLKFPFAKPVSVRARPLDRISAMDMANMGTELAAVPLQVMERARYLQRPLERWTPRTHWRTWRP